MPFDPKLQDLIEQINEDKANDMISANTGGQILPSNPAATTSRYGGPFATLGTNSNFTNPDETLPQTAMGHAEEGAGYSEPQPSIDTLPQTATPTRTTAAAVPKTATPSPLAGLNLSTGLNTEGTLDNLKSAQDEANQNRNVDNLFKALNLVGAGASKTAPVGQQYWDEQLKQANQPVEQLNERVAMEQKDPNSDVSKSWQAMLKQYNISADGMSAEQGAKLFPLIYQAFERAEAAKISAQQRADHNKDMLALGMRRADNSERGTDLREEHNDVMQDNTVNKRFTSFDKALNQDIASAQTVFGKSANISRAANALEVLRNRMPNSNALTGAEIYEMAKSLDNMLAVNGRGGSIAGTNKLIPTTAAGDVKSIEQYISGIPVGKDQGAFVDRMMATVAAEKKQALDRVKADQSSLLGGYQDLYNEDPKRVDRVLQLHQLPTYKEMYDTETSTNAKNQTTRDAQASGQPAPQSGQNPAPTAMVKMLSPDGRTAMVPSDQVDAALQAGGKLAQ